MKNGTNWTVYLEQEKAKPISEEQIYLPKIYFDDCSE